MRAQPHFCTVISGRQHAGLAPRPHREQHASRFSDADASADPAPLRFWRAIPREAGIICGEGAPAELPLHTHDALQVMLPASPCAVADGGHGAVVVHPGQMHVTAPLELRGMRSLDGAPCAMRLILVLPAALPRLEEALSHLWRGAATGSRQVVVADPRLYAELWTLVGELRAPLVAHECGPRLLGCLARLLFAGVAPPADAPRRRVGRQVAGIRRVRDHLRTHVAESVSLDELASVAGLSKFYLLRAFHREHGVTPHAYQMQLRLAHAWRLIVEGRALTRATYDAGFADQSHLTRRFAALFGLPPARYARLLAEPPGAAQSITRGAEQVGASPSAA